MTIPTGWLHSSSTSRIPRVIRNSRSTGWYGSVLDPSAIDSQQCDGRASSARSSSAAFTFAKSRVSKFITKALMGGFAVPADSPIVPGSPFFSDDIARYPTDLKKAAALLDEAGHKPGADGTRFKLTIDYLPGVDDQQKIVAEYVRTQLKKVGIAVDVRASADFPSWAKRMATHDFDMSMDLVFNWGDPIIGVHRTYLSSNIKPIVWTNTQSYNNPKVDELLNTAGGLLGPTQRKAYYATFQKIVTEDMPIDFINIVPYHTATSKKVGNVPTTIWGPLSPLDEVYLK